MCCVDPIKGSAEYERFYKLQNSSGCCGKNGGCDVPSRAKAGSPLAKWEELYGKLVNYVTVEIGMDGRFYQKIERIPCEETTTGNRQVSCCSLRYKVVR